MLIRKKKRGVHCCSADGKAAAVTARSGAAADRTPPVRLGRLQRLLSCRQCVRLGKTMEQGLTCRGRCALRRSYT